MVYVTNRLQKDEVWQRLLLGDCWHSHCDVIGHCKMSMLSTAGAMLTTLENSVVIWSFKPRSHMCCDLSATALRPKNICYQCNRCATKTVIFHSQINWQSVGDKSPTNWRLVDQNCPWKLATNRRPVGDWVTTGCRLIWDGLWLVGDWLTIGWRWVGGWWVIFLQVSALRYKFQECVRILSLSYGSGHETVTVLLPGLAINW